MALKLTIDRAAPLIQGALQECHTTSINASMNGPTALDPWRHAGKK
jgi:hypothetical protein